MYCNTLTSCGAMLVRGSMHQVMHDVTAQTDFDSRTRSAVV